MIGSGKGSYNESFGVQEMESLGNWATLCCEFHRFSLSPTVNFMSPPVAYRCVRNHLRTMGQPIISASNSLQPSLFIRARTACHRCQLSGRIFGPNIKKNILATPRKRYPGEVSPKNHHADFHQEIHVKSMKSTRTTMSSTTLEGNWLLQLQKFRDSDHVPYESCYLGVIFCHLKASK